MIKVAIVEDDHSVLAKSKTAREFPCRLVCYMRLKG